jgi:hypothetical protein
MARYWDYVGTLVEFQYTKVHGFNEIIIIFCFYARRCLWHYIRALEEYCRDSVASRENSREELHRTYVWCDESFRMVIYLPEETSICVYFFIITFLPISTTRATLDTQQGGEFVSMHAYVLGILSSRRTFSSIAAQCSSNTYSSFYS